MKYIDTMQDLHKLLHLLTVALHKNLWSSVFPLKDSGNGEREAPSQSHQIHLLMRIQ